MVQVTCWNQHNILWLVTITDFQSINVCFSSFTNQLLESVGSYAVLIALVSSVILTHHGLLKQLFARHSCAILMRYKKSSKANIKKFRVKHHFWGICLSCMWYVNKSWKYLQTPLLQSQTNVHQVIKMSNNPSTNHKQSKDIIHTK